MSPFPNLRQLGAPTHMEPIGYRMPFAMIGAKVRVRMPFAMIGAKVRVRVRMPFAMIGAKADA